MLWCYSQSACPTTTSYLSCVCHGTDWMKGGGKGVVGGWGGGKEYKSRGVEKR